MFQNGGREQTCVTSDKGAFCRRTTSYIAVVIIIRDIPCPEARMGVTITVVVIIYFFFTIIIRASELEFVLASIRFIY